MVFSKSSRPAVEKMLDMKTPNVCPRTPANPNNGIVVINASAMRI